MRNSSFIIRFIDIGLIILFGFLIISDITIRSELEMSGSESNKSGEDEGKDPRQIQLLVIKVDIDGLISVSDYKTSIQLGEYSDTNLLRDQLKLLRQETEKRNESVAALIEMQERVTMQQLIDILDLCDELGIPKNINVQALRL